MPVIKVKQIEKRAGKSIRDVLCDQYEKHGDSARPQETIAHELGVSQSTLSLWLKMHGLKRKTVLVPCGKEDA